MVPIEACVKLAILRAMLSTPFNIEYTYNLSEGTLCGTSETLYEKAQDDERSSYF